jgi:cytidylate kinase
MIIALDGPAGSGKSTIAKLIANKLSIEYLDTGAMYRAITYKILRENINYNDSEILIAFLCNTDIDFIDNQIYLDGENISEQIRTPEVTENVSTIASISQVREVLVDFQRRIAENRNIVMDGRDIGTKVIPNTKYKFFITASLEERARRRFVEMKTKGFDVELEEIKEAIDLRDKADSQREDSPLVMASDAKLIDTTGKTINQVVDAVIEEINNL